MTAKSRNKYSMPAIIDRIDGVADCAIRHDTTKVTDCPGIPIIICGSAVLTAATCIKDEQGVDPVLSGHSQEGEESDARWSCDVCEPCTIFFTRKELELHEIRFHHRCIQCDRVFRSRDNLISHLRTVFHKPTAIRCISGKCSDRFPSLSEALAHIEVGACPSELKAEEIDRWVSKIDILHLFTVPGASEKLAERNIYIKKESVDVNNREVFNDEAAGWSSTREAFAGEGFRRYGSLKAHEARSDYVHCDIPRIYRCPRGDDSSHCSRYFSTLNSLARHVEVDRCGAKWTLLYPIKEAIMKQLMTARVERVWLPEPLVYKRAFRAAYPTMVARVRGA